MDQGVRATRREGSHLSGRPEMRTFFHKEIPCVFPLFEFPFFIILKLFFSPFLGYFFFFFFFIELYSFTRNDLPYILWLESMG